MEVVDLFSGIGGFSVASEAVGWHVAAHCEFAPFPTAVLKKQWPDVPHFGDVRTLDAAALRSAGVSQVDVITGGFPCQDVSHNGRQKGLGTHEDPTRSGLFRNIVRLADETEASYVVMENVRGLLDNGLDYVAAVFDMLGWTLEWRTAPAWEIGAPQERLRVWMVAHRSKPFVFGRFGTYRGDRVGTGWIPDGVLFDDSLIDQTTKMPPSGYVFGGELYELPWSRIKRDDLWPTCRASEYKDCGPIGSKSQKHMFKRSYLCAHVTHWEDQRSPQQQPTPKLNPDWVESFMGYGQGWTDLARTDSDAFVRFPAGPGVDQFDWEAERQTRRSDGRASRIMALGNTVLPQAAEHVMRLIEGAR